jgi:hypothetical protein
LRRNSRSAGLAVSEKPLLQAQYNLEFIGSALSEKLAAINPATMISEALKERPKGGRLALAGQKKKITRRVAPVKSKCGR